MCLIMCLFGFALLSHAAPPAEKRAGDAGPQLWTKLQENFDSTKVKVGDTLSAEATYDWYAPDCTVAAGTVVLGKVENVVQPSAASNASEVSLKFAVGCMGGRRVLVSLIAVLYAKDDGKGQMDVYNSMPAGSQLGGGAGMGRSGVRTDLMPTPGLVQSPPSPVKVGQVTGMHHLSLSVPAGVNQGANLKTTEKRLRMESGTRLVFQMATSGK